MNIYLPIAEMSVNIFLLLGLGGVTGVLSGMFGIGGGFLLTPFLIFIGVPPAVAVATSANQIIASSASGFLAHRKRQNVDFKMGIFLLGGGFVGSTLGVALFRWLKVSGHIDMTISLLYVVFLSAVGIIMAAEGLRSLLHARKKTPAVEKPKLGSALPWQVHFPHSKLTVSALLPLVIGFAIGIMVSLLGVGGGFFLIPAMIYILGMPTAVVIGTSLFQMIFITANVTFLQAVTTQTVDIMLAVLLLAGSVVGAQIGSKIGARLPAERLRVLLAAMVLVVALKLVTDVFTPPANIYSVDYNE